MRVEIGQCVLFLYMLHYKNALKHSLMRDLK